MKFKKECNKFVNALMNMDFNEMKDLQDNTNMERIKEKMENFIREVNFLQAGKRKSRSENSHQNKNSRSENSEEGFGFGSDVECESVFCKAKKVVKRFGTWLLGFFWS